VLGIVCDIIVILSGTEGPLPSFRHSLISSGLVSLQSKRPRTGFELNHRGPSTARLLRCAPNEHNHDAACTIV